MKLLREMLPVIVGVAIAQCIVLWLGAATIVILARVLISMGVQIHL